MEKTIAPTVEIKNPNTILKVNLCPAKINLDKMHVNKSFVFAKSCVKSEQFFSLLMKKLVFKTMHKEQLIKIKIKILYKEPTSSFSTKYFSSAKYKINFLYSPVVKININKAGTEI